MKLYTEEQVKDAFIKGFYTDNFSIPFSEGFAIKQTTDSYTREFMKSLTPIELPSDEEIIGRFMNWFLKHYSTATIDGFFGYVNALEEEVSIKEILDDYLNQNK